MNDDILKDIHQQLTEINKKSPNIPWRMVRIVGSIFVVILLTVSADMLYDVISDWRKKPVDSWDAVERLANRADLAQAYDMALRLEQKAPMDWTAAYHKGDLLVQMRKLDLALAEFQKAYQVFPNDRLKERIDVVTKALEDKKVPNKVVQSSDANAPQTEN